MKNISELVASANNFLCVGLDSDLHKIPATFKRYKNPVLEFNRAVVEATAPYCVSYKINTAFYESQGAQGWEIMQKTLQHIPDDKFVIADAKRGDIGNTATQYAKAFFESLSFDAITLNPYMGKDTIAPFLEFEDKTVIILALTSNPGSADFEQLKTKTGGMVYEEIMKSIVAWAPAERTHFVVGATHPEAFQGIRKMAPDNFFLVPGVGTQGGSLEAVYNNGKNDQTGLLVNVSRAVIYAGNNQKDPMVAVAEAAQQYDADMKKLMNNV